MTDRYEPLRQAANALTYAQYAAKLACYLAEKRARLEKIGKLPVRK